MKKFLPPILLGLLCLFCFGGLPAFGQTFSATGIITSFNDDGTPGTIVPVPSSNSSDFSLTLEFNPVVITASLLNGGNAKGIKISYRKSGASNFNQKTEIIYTDFSDNTYFPISYYIPQGPHDIRMVAVSDPARENSEIGTPFIIPRITISNSLAAPTVTNPPVTSSSSGNEPNDPFIFSNPCSIPIQTAFYNNSAITSIRVRWRRYKFESEKSIGKNSARVSVNVSPTTTIALGGLLRQNQNYELEIIGGTGTDPEGKDFQPRTLPAIVYIKTGFVTGNIIAQVTNPPDNSTGVSVTPTFTASARSATCGTVASVVYEIATDEAFTSIVPMSYPEVPATGNFQWIPTTALEPQRTYFARVVSGRVASGGGGVLSGLLPNQTPIPYIRFTTTNPLNVTSPANGATVDVCGFPVTADPFAAATRLLVTYAVGSGLAADNSIWSTSTVINNGVTIAASGDGSFSGTVPKPSALRLEPSTDYTLRIQAFNAGNTLMTTVLRTVRTNPSNTTYKPVFGAEERAPAPDNAMVTVPADGSTNVAVTPTFKIDAYKGCATVIPTGPSALLGLLEIDVTGTSGTPAWSGANYIAVPFFNNNPGPYNYSIPEGMSLLPQRGYAARFTFYTTSRQPDNQTTITFTTGNYLLPTRVLQFNNGASFVPFVNGAYRNGVIQRFRTQLIAQATFYEWQFSKDPVNFSNPITLTSPDILLEFNAAANGFESGERYFVRVRGRDNNGNASLWPAASGAAIVNYHHPLFAPYVTSPTVDNLNSRRFTVKSTIVGNGTNFFFQIVKANPANDQTPLADFVDGNYFQNPPNFPQSNMSSFSLTTESSGLPVEGVANPGGSLFHALDWRQYWWGVEVRFNYLQMQPQTRYRVRVIAARMVNGQFVQQTDLGLVGITNFGTMGITDRKHPILNIADNETDVENRESMGYTRITVLGSALLWDITQYQLQVSETSFSGPDDSRGIIQNIDGVSEGNPVFFVPGLNFMTRYYVRARSLANVNGVPQWSAWSDPAEGGISFTTKRVPTPAGINLNNVTSNRSAQISVGLVSVADRYEWTLERLSDGAATYPAKVTDWVNATFTENLVQGVQYRLTVRAFSSAQAPDDAAYSLPISTTFTINSNAARNANDPAAAGTTEFLSSALFPNPFQRETRLQLNTGYGKVQVKAVGLTGQVMLLKEATGGDAILLGLNWPVGMYIVQVVTEKGVSETYRIVKH